MILAYAVSPSNTLDQLGLVAGKEGLLISPCYSLELCIQMGVSFLFSFAFHFSSFHSYL